MLWANRCAAEANDFDATSRLPPSEIIRAVVTLTCRKFHKLVDRDMRVYVGQATGKYS